MIKAVADPAPSASTLVDDDCAARLSQRLLEKVTGASQIALVDLPLLNEVLNLLARKDGSTIEPLIALLEDDEIYIQYLASAPIGVTFAFLRAGLPALLGDFATFSERFNGLKPQLQQRTDGRAVMALTTESEFGKAATRPRIRQRPIRGASARPLSSSGRRWADRAQWATTFEDSRRHRGRRVRHEGGRGPGAVPSR